MSPGSDAEMDSSVDGPTVDTALVDRIDTGLTDGTLDAPTAQEDSTVTDVAVDVQLEVGADVTADAPEDARTDLGPEGGPPSCRSLQPVEAIYGDFYSTRPEPVEFVFDFQGDGGQDRVILQPNTREFRVDIFLDSGAGPVFLTARDSVARVYRLDYNGDGSDDFVAELVLESFPYNNVVLFAVLSGPTTTSASYDALEDTGEVLPRLTHSIDLNGDGFLSRREYLTDLPGYNGTTRRLGDTVFLVWAGDFSSIALEAPCSDRLLVRFTSTSTPIIRPGEPEIECALVPSLGRFVHEATFVISSTGELTQDRTATRCLSSLP